VRGEHETDGNEQHGHQHVRLVLLGEETLERLAERSEDVPRGLRAEERAKRGVTSVHTSRREAPTPAADAARPERGRFPNREATHLVQQVELVLEHPPRRARPTRRPPRREAGDPRGRV
jgi:hypothetical protein